MSLNTWLGFSRLPKIGQGVAEKTNSHIFTRCDFLSNILKVANKTANEIANKIGVAGSFRGATSNTSTGIENSGAKGIMLIQ